MSTAIVEAGEDHQPLLQTPWSECFRGLQLLVLSEDGFVSTLGYLLSGFKVVLQTNKEILELAFHHPLHQHGHKGRLSPYRAYHRYLRVISGNSLEMHLYGHAFDHGHIPIVDVNGEGLPGSGVGDSLADKCLAIEVTLAFASHAGLAVGLMRAGEVGIKIDDVTELGV